jgi:copper chaperone NosL
MNKKFNIVILIASVIPLALFFLPLWVIDLQAPQFPEGLAMNIYINDVTGTEEHGLESINGLNHYIGMKKIEPEGIPELKYMPIVLVIISILGFATAFINKNMITLIWLTLFSVAGAIGIYDFYLWESDYGQNLDPNAIIKSEDAVYQPPLIGSKEIMNFRVTSLPGSGGWILFASLFGGWASYIISVRKSKSSTTTVAASAIILLALISSCSKSPEPIDYGKEECALCKMIITEQKYGSEIITNKGKIYKFDAVECMGKYINDGKIEQSELASVWSVDYSNPGQFVDVEKAFFLRSPSLPSPMAMNFTTFSESSKRDEVRREHPGDNLNWQQVLGVIKKEWSF